MGLSNKWKPSIRWECTRGEYAKSSYTFGGWSIEGGIGRMVPNNKGQLTQIGSLPFRKATDHEANESIIIGKTPQYTELEFLNNGWKQGFIKSSKGGPGIALLCNTDMGMRDSSGYKLALKNISTNYPQMQRNEAVTKALNKIADQKVNLGENLATFGMTARLFASNAKSIADFLRAWKRDADMLPHLYKSFRRLREDGVARRISERYLEYVYGVKPLVNDCFALYELMKATDPASLLLNAEGYSFRNYRLQDGDTGTDSRNNITCTYVSGDSQCMVRSQIWARINPDWSGTRALNQLGLFNPISLVWELVPWSFVVDWVLPIGPVLSAMTAPAGLDYIDGSLSAKRTSTLHFESKHTWPGTTRNVRETPGTGHALVKAYKRSRQTTWPIPGLWIDPDPLRGDRIFKAAALAILALK